jgi:hypothetical protein
LPRAAAQLTCLNHRPGPTRILRWFVIEWSNCIMNIDRRTLFRLTTLAAALGLLSPAARAQAAPQIDARAMFERLAKDGKGFDMQPSVGPREPVYIVFDPQCRYCVTLWEAARPIARGTGEYAVLAGALQGEALKKALGIG